MNQNDRRPHAVRRPQNVSAERQKTPEKASVRRTAARRRPSDIAQGNRAGSRGLETGRFSMNRPEVETNLKKNRKTENEKALVSVKKEQRALALAKKESDWQNEVERVRGGVDKIMLGIIVVLLALGALMVYTYAPSPYPPIRGSLYPNRGQ